MSIPPSPEKNSIEINAFLKSEPAPARWHILAPLIALCGGVFGILGAAYTELKYGSFLIAFVGAPIIEEALKPSGVYLLLAKWPKALRNQHYTAFLAALGGIAFALIENVVYLYVYYPRLSPNHAEPSAILVLWRYTVCVGIHAVCSFIFGLGINQKLLASVKGEIGFLSCGKRFFFTAIGLHSLYNIVVCLLELTGHLKFSVFNPFSG